MNIPKYKRPLDSKISKDKIRAFTQIYELNSIDINVLLNRATTTIGYVVPIIIDDNALRNFELTIKKLKNNITNFLKAYRFFLGAKNIIEEIEKDEALSGFHGMTYTSYEKTLYETFLKYKKDKNELELSINITDLVNHYIILLNFLITKAKELSGMEEESFDKTPISDNDLIRILNEKKLNLNNAIILIDRAKREIILAEVNAEEIQLAKKEVDDVSDYIKTAIETVNNNLRQKYENMVKSVEQTVKDLNINKAKIDRLIASGLHNNDDFETFFQIRSEIKKLYYKIGLLRDSNDFLNFEFDKQIMLISTLNKKKETLKIQNDLNVVLKNFLLETAIKLTRILSEFNDNISSIGRSKYEISLEVYLEEIDELTKTLKILDFIDDETQLLTPVEINEITVELNHAKQIIKKIYNQPNFLKKIKEYIFKKIENLEKNVLLLKQIINREIEQKKNGKTKITEKREYDELKKAIETDLTLLERTNIFSNLLSAEDNRLLSNIKIEARQITEKSTENILKSIPYIRKNKSISPYKFEEEVPSPSPPVGFEKELLPQPLQLSKIQNVSRSLLEEEVPSPSPVIIPISIEEFNRRRELDKQIEKGFTGGKRKILKTYK